MRWIAVFLLGVVPASADSPPSVPVDGDALYACFEVVDEAPDGRRAICAGTAAAACLADPGEFTALDCLAAETAIWDGLLADWIWLVGGALRGAAWGDFQTEQALWDMEAGICLAGAPEAQARCGLDRRAARVDALIRRFRLIGQQH